MMIGFQVTAIPTEVAQQARAMRRSPQYGHPAYEELLSEAGPCRHCLRLIRAGEHALLFTYDPFRGDARPLPGPVYIHAEPCIRYRESNEFPAELRDSPRTLAAYGTERRILGEILVPANGDFEGGMASLASNSEVGYVHVRSTTAGCFTFRAERAREHAIGNGSILPVSRLKNTPR